MLSKSIKYTTDLYGLIFGVSIVTFEQIQLKNLVHYPFYTKCRKMVTASFFKHFWSFFIVMYERVNTLSG